ncbi:MAG: SusD/RagB family nutrient-binding outer membrane lipoprotein [Bacteroidota bacterium]
MIRYIKTSLIVFAMLIANACTEDFAELNTNPNQLPDLDVGFQLGRAMIASSDSRFEYWRSNLIYPTAIAQQATNTWWTGNTYGISDQWAGAWWERYYTGYGKNLTDLIARADPETESNTIQAARIFRVHLFQRLTDLYGDAPWFGAGKGFLEANFTPEYDDQEVIYDDLLKEVTEASAALDESQPEIRGDVIFDGDVSKWKKFANSLRLRLGMRLSEVNPAKAESEVSAAFAAGVMTSLDDQPVFVHDVNFQNGNSQVVRSDHFFLHDTMVEFMKATNDPRLTVYGGVYVDGDKQDVSVEEFYGLPLGGQSAENPAAPEAPLARINLDHFSQLEVPYVHMRYVEVELLLAEAAARGWIASDAAMHYEAGVTAGMKMWEIYPGNPTIADADIAAYLAGNPFDGSSLDAALETINMQFWVSMFMNGFESYANYRRVNIPNLAPSTHPARAITTVPLKMPYPVREDGDNKANFQPAVAKQNVTGTNDLSGRVWWDVD